MKDTREAAEYLTAGEVLRVLASDSGRWRRYDPDLSWIENGRTSLDAYSAVLRLEKELSVVVPVHVLLGTSTLREIASEVAAANPVPLLESPARVSAPPAELVLTPTQRRHMRHARSLGSGKYLNVFTVLKSTGHLDPVRAEMAFRAVLAAHDITNFVYSPSDDGLATARRIPGARQSVPFVRMAGVPNADIALTLIRADALADFDLENLPPFRGGTVSLPDGSGFAYLVAHHMVSDSWSMDVFRRDFERAYYRTELGFEDAYGRYVNELVASLDAGEFAESLDYWVAKLDGVSPTFTLASKDSVAEGHEAGTIRIAFESSLIQGLRDFSQNNGVSVYGCLLASAMLAAHALTGEADITMMSGVANRNREAYAETVGLFTNQIFFVSSSQPDLSLREYARARQEDVVESLANSELPAEVVLERLDGYRASTLAPYANVLFQAAEADSTVRADAEAEWSEVVLPGRSIKRHCNLHVEDYGDDVTIHFDYSVRAMGHERARKYADLLRAAVEYLTTLPDEPVSSFLRAPMELSSPSAANEAPQRFGIDAAVFTVDYPGARAEPSLSSVMQAALPATSSKSLPVPTAVDRAHVDAVIAEWANQLEDANRPLVLLAYCSAASWAAYVLNLLPSDVRERVTLVALNPVDWSAAEWNGELSEVLARYSSGSATGASRTVVSSATVTDGQWVEAVASARGELEDALVSRFGAGAAKSPATLDLLSLQMQWLSFLSFAVRGSSRDVPPEVTYRPVQVVLEGTASRFAEAVMSAVPALAIESRREVQTA